MLAIIPARGGSKGLLNKNIRLFNGKPLIAYTIEEAKKSKYIDRVVVSTDSKNIAEVGIEYGADIPFFRPKDLAKDDSLAIDTYFYTIDRLMKERNYNVKEFIVLQPTSPLRTVCHINNAIKLFYDKDVDAVISVSKNKHPIEWTKSISNNRLVSLFEENNLNRQKYKATFHPNGMIFIFNYSALKKSKTCYMENTYPLIIENQFAVDIDDINDFEYAEFLYKKLHF